MTDDDDDLLNVVAVDVVSCRVQVSRELREIINRSRCVHRNHWIWNGLECPLLVSVVLVRASLSRRRFFSQRCTNDAVVNTVLGEYCI